MHPTRRYTSRSTRLVVLALALALVAATGCRSRSILAPEPALQDAGGTRAAAPRGYAGDVAGARHVEGVIGDGALYTLDAPAAWNGDLVVYLHGYSNPADPVARPNNGAIRDSLLARGVAVASSSYSSNGFAVSEGVRQSLQLRGLFTSRIARPRRTWLFGQSLGGLIGMILSQRYPEQFNGSLLVCGIVGGAKEEIEYVGDIRVLFDALYPHVLAGDLEHTPPITDINHQVVQPVVQAVTANPQGLGIIQRLARHPLPGNTTQEIVTSLVNVLGFAAQGGSDLFDRTHEHTYFDNAGWQYTGPGLPQSLIDDVNARVARYTADPSGLEFLGRNGDASLPLRVPVMAIHTTRDPVVPVFHEDLLAQANAGPNLRQYRTDRYGHCNFTVGELMQRFDELVAWSASHAAL